MTNYQERRKDYHEIMLKIDALLEKMEEHQASDNRIFDAIQKSLNRINDVVIGDGDKIGLAEKIRSIENVQKDANNAHGHIKVIWATVAAGVCEFIWRTFFHHHRGG